MPPCRIKDLRSIACQLRAHRPSPTHEATSPDRSAARIHRRALPSLRDRRRRVRQTAELGRLTEIAAIESGLRVLRTMASRAQGGVTLDGSIS